MKKQTKLGLVLAAAAVISVSVASLVSAKGWVQNGADWYYVDNSGEYVTETIQSSGNAKFYLGEDGAMQRDFFLEDYNGNTYYFGQNGAMVTNTWVAIESSRVESQEDYVPDNYWYYFQASGKAIKGSSTSEKKTTIDGKKHAFNQYGQMLTGWITGDGKTVADDVENPFADALYYAGGDNDGVLRSGWLTYYDGYAGDDDNFASKYTNLYFYFNTSNNKKYGYNKKETKKINGKTYAFNDNGIMMSGWDVLEQGGLLDGKTTYFSTEDDGHQVKKGWVYAVPSASIDSKANDNDDEKYMYFNASGEIVKDQFRKVNGKYYVFNKKGIMKTGVVLWAPNGDIDGGKFVDTLDLDWATGEEVSKKGRLKTGDGDADYYEVYPNGQIKSGTYKGKQIRLHLFGSDGARKTGLNNVEFADETFALFTNAAGNKNSGLSAKKYYSLGIQLKANADIRYGIYNTDLSTTSTTGAFTAQNGDTWLNGLGTNGKYNVLNTSGSLVKGNSAAKKDADGNYWMINKDTNSLVGIWSVNVKSNASIGSSFKTRVIESDLSSLIDSKTKESKADYTLAKIIASTSVVQQADLDEWFDSDEVEDPSVINTWTWKVVDCGTGYCLRVVKGGNTWGYQAENMNDKSNVWTPFGFYDNDGKTVSLENDRKDFRVEPTDDYFVNCYWK